MKKEHVRLLTVFFLSVMLMNTAAAMNEVDFFNGPITIDGIDVAVDTVLKAYAEGTNIKNFTLTSAGQYGIQIVNGQGASSEDNITFRISDIVADQSATADLSQVFLSRPLNLTFSDTSVPSAPSNVAVSEVLNVSMTNASLNISWSAASDNFWTDLNYNLYIGDSSGVTSATGTFITTTNATSYLYEDTGLVPDGSDYYIVVYANDTSGNVGPKSDAASVTLTDRTPKPVTGPQIESLDQALNITWNAVTQNTDNSLCSGLSGYHIYTNSSGSWNLIDTKSGTDHLESGLTNGQQYYFKIAAFDSDGDESANVSVSGIPATVPVITPDISGGSYIRNSTDLSFTIESDILLDTCIYTTYINLVLDAVTSNSSCVSPHIITLSSVSQDDNTTYTVEISANDTDSREIEQNFTYIFDTSAPVTSDDAPVSWQTADFNITLTETDTVSGIAATYYCTDTENSCTPTSTYTSPVTITIEADQYFRYFSTDNAGNNQTTTSKNIKLDKTAPTTTDNYGAKDAQWQSVDQTIILNEDCDASGCNWTKYCTDTNNTCNPSTGTEYTTPVNITSEGTSYFRYASKDNAGNTQSTNSLQVKIDKIVPSSTDDYGGKDGQWQSADQSITLTENCSLSGCNWTKYCTDTENSCNPSSGTDYSAPISITSEGTTYVRYATANNAENTQSTVSVQVKIDKTAPSVNLVSADDQYIDDATPDLTFNVGDNLDSSLNCYLDINSTYYDSNASTVSGADTLLTANSSLADGSYSWNVLCSDDAGNSNNVSIARKSFRIDRTAPVLLSNSTDASAYDMTEIATIITRWNDQYLDIGSITCSLYVDGALDSTINSTGQWCNFSQVIALADYPEITFSVSAFDSFGKTTDSPNMTVDVNALNCGMTLMGDLTLTSGLDCSSSETDGFIIGADGMTLDCAGNQLIGGESDSGIDLNGKDNVTIQNCGLSSWAKGITINGGGTLVENNSIDDSTTAGIHILEGSSNNISSNTLINNTVGVQIDTDNNVLIDNMISLSSTAAMQGEGTGTSWYILNSAGLTGNDAVIQGTMTFDRGVLELLNSNITLNGVLMDLTGNISSLSLEQPDFVSDVVTELEFDDEDSNISFSLSVNASSTIFVSSVVPNASGTTSDLDVLKGIDVLVDTTTESQLSWALIKIFYNASELTTAGVEESRLKIYYYNETSGNWQLEGSQGVDTSGDYVWANVTHMSMFGVFESAVVSSSGNGGGSGRSSSLRICTEDIVCSEWSDCVLNSQTRTCVDNNGCSEDKTEKRICAPPPKKTVRPEAKAEIAETEEVGVIEKTTIESEEQTENVDVPQITGMAVTENKDKPFTVNKFLLIAIISFCCMVVMLVIMKYQQKKEYV